MMRKAITQSALLLSLASLTFPALAENGRPSPLSCSEYVDEKLPPAKKTLIDIYLSGIYSGHQIAKGHDRDRPSLRVDVRAFLGKVAEACKAGAPDIYTGAVQALKD